MAIDRDVVLKNVSEFKATAAGAIDALRHCRGFFAILRELCKVVPEVVSHVEKFSAAKDLCSEDKKALAMEILDALIPWPVWLPGFIHRPILDMAVESAVGSFNKVWKPQK